MNPTQIHLIVNHIAVIGFPLILLIGILAIIFKSEQYRRLVYGLTIVCSLGGFIAYFSGEQAEHRRYEAESFAPTPKNEYGEYRNELVSENEYSSPAKSGSKPNVCFSEAELEAHEELAEQTVVFLALCCGIAIMAGISGFKFVKMEVKLFGILILAMAITCFWLGKTAHQGGRINHTEIR